MPAGISHDKAEQVLLHAPLGEVVALEVEKYVAFRRLGKKSKAVFGVERFLEFVERLAAVAVHLLHPGLIPNASRGRYRATGRRRHGIESGQIFEPLNVEGAETLDLPAGYAGHVAEVVVVRPAFFAVEPPRAIVAVGHTLRVGRAGVAEEGVHLTGQQPEVGTVVFDAVALRLEVAAGRDHVHVGGSDALDFLEQMRIDAKLQDRRRTGIAGEFRVVDLVGPVAETAGRRYLQQEVPAPRPFVVRKGCLVNDVHASAHLGDGRPNVAPRSVYDGAALAPQPVEIGLLVLHALLAQVFEHRTVSE